MAEVPVKRLTNGQGDDILIFKAIPLLVFLPLIPPLKFRRRLAVFLKLASLCLAPLATDKWDAWLFVFGLIIFGITASGSIIIFRRLKDGGAS